MFSAWPGWALRHSERFKKAHHYLPAALKIGEEKKSSRVIGYACCRLPWACNELGISASA